MQPVSISQDLKFLQSLSDSMDRLGVDQQGRIFKHQNKPETPCDQDTLEMALTNLISDLLLDFAGESIALDKAVVSLKLPRVTKSFKEAAACYPLISVFNEPIFTYLPSSFPFSENHHIIVRHHLETGKTMAVYFNIVKNIHVEVPVDNRSVAAIDEDMLKVDASALEDMEVRLKEILGQDQVILRWVRTSKGKIEFPPYEEMPELMAELNKKGYAVMLPFCGNSKLEAGVYTKNATNWITRTDVKFEDLAEHVKKLNKP